LGLNWEKAKRVVIGDHWKLSSNPLLSKRVQVRGVLHAIFMFEYESYEWWYELYACSCSDCIFCNSGKFLPGDAWCYTKIHTWRHILDHQATHDAIPKLWVFGWAAWQWWTPSWRCELNWLDFYVFRVLEGFWLGRNHVLRIYECLGII